MRKSLIAGVAVFSLGFGLFVTAPKARAADEKEIKGVLIDSHCGDKYASKDDPEKEAAGHPKACCLKCAKGGETMLIYSGKTKYTLDDESSKKAKEYLEKNDTTKVMVKGEEKDGKLAISSIEPQK
jgi:hypothetical protein